MAHKEFDAQHLDELSQLGTKFAEAIISAKPKMLAEVFHEDATLFGDTNGPPLGRHVDSFYQALEDLGTSPKMTYHVDVVDATPTTAILRVYVDNLASGFGYIDHLSVVKIDGKWQIVCKIFHEYKSKD